MFGLESEASVQRRYNLSKTTLQQSRLWGMAHTHILEFSYKLDTVFLVNFSRQNNMYN